MPDTFSATDNEIYSFTKIESRGHPVAVGWLAVDGLASEMPNACTDPANTAISVSKPMFRLARGLKGNLKLDALTLGLDAWPAFWFFDGT